MAFSTTTDAVEIISEDMLARWQMKVPDQSLSSWTGLVCLAAELRCRIDYTNDAAYYVPSDDFDDSEPFGTMFLNPRVGSTFFLRNAAHELCHHTVYCWDEFRWPKPWARLYEQNLSLDLEERLCDAMANLIRSVPEGYQDNGKFVGSVESGPVLRRGWHNPIPAYMAMPAQEIKRHDAAHKLEADDELLSLFLEIKANLNLHE